MKKFINLLLLALVVSSCNDSHRIIDNPYVESANSNIYDVTRVELSDTATVVHLETYYLPGWWIMPLRAMCLRVDGEKYTATKIEGANFDERFWMHPDGHAPMIATFPPIPKDAKQMDFFNGYYEVSTDRLFGIDLTGKKRARKYHRDLPLKYRKPIAKGDVKLPELSYEIGESEIRLHLLGYRDSLMDSRVEIGVRDIFDKRFYYSNVDAEGNLSFRMPLYGTSLVEIGYMDAFRHENYFPSATDARIYSVYVEPGEVTDVYIDLTKRGEWLRNRRNGLHTYDMGLYTSGRYAEVNRQINSLPYQVRMDPRPILHNFVDYRMSTEDYISHVKARYHECRDSIANARDLTPMQKRYSVSRLNDEYVMYAMDPVGFLFSNFRLGGGRNYHGIHLPDSVKLAEFNLGHTADMVREMNLKADDLSIFEQMSRTNISTACCHEKFGYAFDFFAEVRLNIFDVYQKIINWRQLEPADIEKINGVKNKALVDMLRAMIAEKQQRAVTVAENVFFEPTPEGSAKEMFDAIMAPHKGKVVVMRQRHLIRNEREELNDVRKFSQLRRETSEQGVVWIDLCWSRTTDFGYTPSVAALKSALLESSESLHYMLPAEKEREMRNAIAEGYDGSYPHYYIIDRQGNVEPYSSYPYGNVQTGSVTDGIRVTDKLRRKIQEKLK